MNQAEGHDGLPPEFVALIAAGLPHAALNEALWEAERSAVAPFDALLASGTFDEAWLVATLAKALGVDPFVDGPPPDAPEIDADACGIALRTGQLRIDGPDGRVRLLVAARGPGVGALARRDRSRDVVNSPIALAGPRAFADAVVARAGSALAERAALGAAVVAPRFTVASAMPRIGPGVRVAILGLAAAVIALIWMSPVVNALVVASVGVLFLALNTFRLWLAMTPDIDDLPPERSDDRNLPIYTVLVGLANEAAVVPGLLDALERLDYPALCIKRTNLSRQVFSRLSPAYQ